MVKATGSPAQNAHPRGRGTGWGTGLPTGHNTQASPSGTHPLPVPPGTHLRKADTQISTRASVSNTGLRMIVRYTGNIPEYHSQVDTSNNPDQVHIGKTYFKVKYYGNRLVPFPWTTTTICLRNTYFFFFLILLLRLTCTHTSYKGLRCTPFTLSLNLWHIKVTNLGPLCT